MGRKFTLLLVVGSFFATPFLHAQSSDSCKVLMKELSDVYTGKCKDGLAHGKGKAEGVDSYVGMFANGVPDGKGVYTYQNGNTYSGYWSKGVKHGKGKFTFDLAGKAIVQKGYWKNGDFFGNTNPDELYRITNQSGIESCTITKKESEEVQIRISFVGAMAKYVPRDLEVTTTSGQLTKENKNFTIYNYSSPNLCTVRFVIPTAGGDRICSLSFEILTVGEYEVLITN